MKNRELELYLHIPFCVKKCAYCDFLSFPSEDRIKKEYVRKLTEEIEKVGKQYREYEVSSIFMGGGTPSILDSEWIVGIFDALRKNFSISGEAEISLEANPGTVTRKKLNDFRRAGINRLSFGLQSADSRELALLGRIHTYEDFLESFRLARECGFENINVDLMSALPGQRPKGWEETLKRVTGLSPEHISAYSLILEEGTPFYEMYGEGKGEGILPGEEEDREMYHRTKELLRSCGYTRYEISNYAREGRECRHNIGYWTGISYLGLGLGAASYIEGTRFSNVKKLSEYLTGRPGNYCEVQRLTDKEKQEEFFFVGLRMVKGVSLKAFEEQFHVPAENVYPGLMEKLVREGVSCLEGEWFRLTDYGLDVSNYVMAEFLQD